MWISAISNSFLYKKKYDIYVYKNMWISGLILLWSICSLHNCVVPAKAFLLKMKHYILSSIHFCSLTSVLVRDSACKLINLVIVKYFCFAAFWISLVPYSGNYTASIIDRVSLHYEFFLPFKFIFSKKYQVSLLHLYVLYF